MMSNMYKIKILKNENHEMKKMVVARKDTSDMVYFDEGFFRGLSGNTSMSHLRRSSIGPGRKDLVTSATTAAQSASA